MSVFGQKQTWHEGQTRASVRNTRRINSAHEDLDRGIRIFFGACGTFGGVS